jgi:hypothetical protein
MTPIRNKHSVTDQGECRINLTLDPLAIILNSVALGDVIAAAPVIKYMLDNHFTTPESHIIVAKKLFRDVLHFVDDSSFRDFDSTEHPFWGIPSNFPVAMLNTKSEAKFIRNTPKSVHLSQFAGIKFCDRIIPLEELNYVPLKPVDVSKFGVDFSKSVILVTTYRDDTRAWHAEHILGVAKWIKARGLTPVFIGKTDQNFQVRDKIIIAKTTLPDDISEYGVDLRNKTSIPELATIMGMSKAVCGVDSGPIHLAGTTETPILCGYTSVAPEYRMPTRKVGKTYAITANIECIGCESRWSASFWNYEKCYLGHINCCKLLTPDRYIKILENIV